jgi:hypothetical protein
VIGCWHAHTTDAVHSGLMLLALEVTYLVPFELWLLS